MDLLHHLVLERGFFTRSDAKADGYGDRAIALAVRTGRWRRFRHGYYCAAAVWDTLDAEARHRIRSAAVLHSLGDRVALSHVSAALAHGMDVWGLSLDRVHVTRLDGASGRLEGDVVHHASDVSSHDVVRHGELTLTSPARAAVEAASRATAEQALCVFDSGARRDLFDRKSLRQQFERMEHWPHTRHLHVPVRFVDGRSQSVGESRGRWFFWRQGLPMPELQHPVHGDDGTLIGTSDWWWPTARLLGEFDGRIKYGRLLAEGQHPGDVVWNEKLREDRMREATGCAMIRLVWSDLDRPRATRARVAAALGLAS